MELPLGDRSLIERSIEGMYKVCSRIVVVGGFRIERVTEILRGYSKVHVVENANWRLGMFSSVKVGVRELKAERFFLLPADVPLVPEGVYRQLLSVDCEIVIPTWDEKKGHPILLRKSVVAEILNEPDDSNLRTVIRRRGFQACPVQHEEVLLDVDTMDGYASAKGRFRSVESSAS